jgi:hypothetical protein
MNQNLINPNEFYGLVLPKEFKLIHYSLCLMIDNVLSQGFEKQIMEKKFQDSQIYVPLLCPNEYKEAIMKRYKIYSDYQQ